MCERFAAAMPEARCELVYHTPYQLLVSVVLSAQTTDKMVNRCMAPLYAGDFTPATVLAHGEASLLSKIKSIGLAPTKARNIIKLSEILIQQHHGEVPRARDDLEALPGVGRKTANVVLAEIYGEPTLAVDTHVFRVGARLGWHDQATPAKAEAALLKVIDPSFLPAAHHWLILHGRYLCTARRPACERCPVADLCPSAAAPTATTTATQAGRSTSPAQAQSKRRRKVAS